MKKEEFFKIHDEAHKNKPVNPDIIDHGMNDDVLKFIMSPEYVNAPIDNKIIDEVIEGLK